MRKNILNKTGLKLSKKISKKLGNKRFKSLSIGSLIDEFNKLMDKKHIAKIKIDSVIFFIFIVLAILLLITTVVNPYDSIHIIKWKTIFMLFYILVVVNVLKDSKFLEWISLYILSHTTKIYITLIILTLLLSSIITNDIVLFVIIPITLVLSKYINIFNRDLEKLIILEGISANIGSALTPIGNPQNLFIFYHYHLNILEFIKNMIPFEICGILALMPFLSFEGGEKEYNFEKMEFRLEWIIYVLIFLLVIFSALNIINYCYLFPIILAVLVLKKVNVDYLFLLTFCALFIDIEGMKQLNIINMFYIHCNGIMLIIYSSFLAQILSNVPATILLSNLYHNWNLIAYGVNVGGNGTLIASFANLITLRLSNGKIGVIRFLMFGGLIYVLHLILLVLYVGIINIK